MAITKQKIKLNKEQKAAVEHADGPLLIIAGAGTGKTTVITERIKHLISSGLAKTDEILALTFTDKAAREMEARVDRAMPYGYTQMWISTFHSFCDQILRKEALSIGLDTNFRLMTQAQSVQFVRDNIFEFELDYFRPLGNPTKFVDAMLQHFSRLQDEDVTPDEYLSWVNSKLKDKKYKRSNEEKLEMEKWLELASAYKKYDELKIKEGKMDFGDVITKTLKLFRDRPNVLKNYQEQFKYILVDEFQDTNFAQNELAILLAGDKKNITVTGDDDQCLPGDTLVDLRNGQKRIKEIEVGDEVITGVGKGYLSTSMVVAKNKTKKKTRHLTFITETSKKITVTDNHKMFCMIPGRKIKGGRFYVYLMHREDLGWRLGITDDLAQRLKLERSADKIIAVKSFVNIEEAKLFENIYSMRYQIPTYPFKKRKNMHLTDQWLEKLFSEFDTVKNAKKLVNDIGIDLDAHHYALGAVVRGNKERIKIVLSMCIRRHRTKWARGRVMDSPKVMHKVRVESSSEHVRSKLEKAGVYSTKAKKGWRVKKEFQDITEAGKFAKHLQEVTNGILEVRFNAGTLDGRSRSSLVMPACNILEGMRIPVRRGNNVVYEKVIERSEELKHEDVYDIEIENTHNFIAGGVVVHNSVYRFRGAAVSNIIQFKKVYPDAKIVVLTKNYRTAQEILDKSYELVQFNNPDRLESVENIDKKLIAQRKKVDYEIGFIHKDRVESEAESVARKIGELVNDGEYDFGDVAILVRANNHADAFIRIFQRMSIPYQFLGPGKLFKQDEIIDLISFLKVLYNFEDSVSFYRLLALDYFRVYQKDLIRIGNKAKKDRISLFEAAEKIDEIPVSENTKKKVKMILKIINDNMEKMKKETAGQLLYNFLDETGLLKKLFNPDTAEAEKRAANISKFFEKLKTYEVDNDTADVFSVVDWIELSAELGESPLAANTDWSEVDAVNLLTVHSAKGLEFPVVFLVNLVAQRFPSRERSEMIPIPEELIKEVLPEGNYHTQEERRLFYVGMTRARDKLFLTAADYYGEAKREKKLSPFIFEALGDEVLSAEQKQGSEQLSFLDYEPHEDQTPVPKMEFHIDYLSYSQINTFKICPVHYKMDYILRIQKPDTAALSFGKSIHTTLKDLYQSAIAGQKVNKDVLMDILENNWRTIGYQNKSHAEKMYKKGKELLSEFFEKEFDQNNLPKLLEQKFTVPLDLKYAGEDKRRLVVGGVLDRVDVLKEGIEILDYKTGANVPSQKEVDNDDQLTFYALAATSIPEEPFVAEPKDVKLSLYFFEEQKKISTVRTAEQLIDAQKQIFKVRKEIEESDFKCSGHYFCQTGCEYAMMCNSD